MTKSCHTCDKGMSGADGKRRCRVHGREIGPDSVQARYVDQHGCDAYDREPGSDDQPWFNGALCVTPEQGRGD